MVHLVFLFLCLVPTFVIGETKFPLHSNLGYKNTLQRPNGHPNVTNHYITMRDGVKLFAEVWVWINDTASESEPIAKRACVLVRSPYPRIEQDLALGWLMEGYAVVQEDMRGMQYSGGNFSFFREGADDGYDTIKWISQQEWSNGVVFSYGISADGINALTQAFSLPPWLQSQFIIWAGAQGYEIAYQGGAFRVELVEGWLTTIQRTWVIDVVKEHEGFSDWWKNLTLTDYSKINYPTVHWSGWYDIFLQLQLNTFEGFQKQSSESVRGKSYLVITPHGHCQFLPDIEPFPDSYTTLAISLASEMFKERNNPNYRSKLLSSTKAITMYVMAPRVENPENVGNYWTSVDDWPQPTVVKYYLQQNNKLSDSLPTSSSAYAKYRYDPNVPVITWGGNNLFDICGPRDEQYIDSRDDVLIFTSDPLQQDLAITGRVTANLFVSSNCEDTDFTVKLLDLYPGGYSILIQDGIIRMKWRNGNVVPEQIESGVVYNVTVDIWSTSYIFPKGHSIQVAVSSSNFPRFQANINRFAPISQWPKLKPITATNAVYFSQDYPSYISLPVVQMSDIPPVN